MLHNDEDTSWSAHYFDEGVFPSSDELDARGSDFDESERSGRGGDALDC